MIVRFGQRMRQAFFQQGNPPAPVQKAPKSCRPGVRAELLVSELDLNGLMGGFELNFRCHRLVSWACARRLIGFIHKNNQSTNGGLSPTALLRLSRSKSSLSNSSSMRGRHNSFVARVRYVRLIETALLTHCSL